METTKVYRWARYGTYWTQGTDISTVAHRILVKTLRMLKTFEPTTPEETEALSQEMQRIQAEMFSRTQDTRLLTQEEMEQKISEMQEEIRRLRRMGTPAEKIHPLTMRCRQMQAAWMDTLMRQTPSTGSSSP